MSDKPRIKPTSDNCEWVIKKDEEDLLIYFTGSAYQLQGYWAKIVTMLAEGGGK